MKFRILISSQSSLSLLLLICGVTSLSFSQVLSSKKLDKTPPRIIRACCAFGSDLNMVGIPFAKVNHITSLEKLNKHVYLGDKNEGNGLIYTKRGGFIDIGHLRDQADWTYYLYSLILTNRDQDVLVKKLCYEGGKKHLEINTKGALDSLDCLLLAGKIAYDLSLWHELSTWYGASTLPLIPERFSSFTVEDVYSNLLGVYVAMEAIQSDLPYDDAMTITLLKTLDSLGVVKTEAETNTAMESVRNLWWTRDVRLPRDKVTIERLTDVYTHVRPWLVPDIQYGIHEPKTLRIPTKTSKDRLLTEFYSLKIDLNNKFPVAEIFQDQDHRSITQLDFPIMLNDIERSLKKYMLSLSNAERIVE